MKIFKNILIFCMLFVNIIFDKGGRDGGVLDTEADGTFHLSLYTGSIRAEDKTAQSGG